MSVDDEPLRYRALPLFPLQTVLFPGGLLPLRIFEVRYLDMIGRVHKAGEPFGVVCLTQGSEVRKLAAAPRGPSGDGFADEAFHGLGTLATIEALDRPQPGLMMIQAAGTRRFRIESTEQLRHGLWVADVQILPDDPPVAVPADLEFARQGLHHLVDNIRLHSAEPTMREPFRWDDCGWLANRWSELLPLAPDTKQRLMALDNPLLRLELVVDALHQIGFKLPGAGG